ncbi:hypothetical protein I2486_12390 [Cellulophaga sp. E16_2]|uniref:hypothetical protein n=1 Tax=Cellulophaga sp. E16_2 TaxID=2789297 RepID=UPI001A9261CD|nr:hypothetical protein [Cellulophaga sp. E16_2]MBO0592201.1 hypothetical protein [Cellulophaga sp. E16_2]
MNNPFNYIMLLFVSVFCASCGGGDSSETPTNPVPIPTAALLVFPENNTECNEGEILSETESLVVFKWNDAEDTDSYTVNLKNLNTGATANFNGDQNELPITIQRGTPYEWKVTSKANGTQENTESEAWRFYNAGLAVESHTPFPAEVVFPKMGSMISSGTVALRWVAEDVDDDITSYSVVIDENSVPITVIGETNEMTLDATVLVNRIYHWQVTTLDAQGNTSKSPIFEFRVN